VPIVVLGCRPCRGGALSRRILAGRDELIQKGGWILVAGGRTWGGVVEADAMHAELLELGVGRSEVVRERCSLTTRGNARFSASLLRRAQASRIRLVTCDWHMPRAAALFRRQGLQVIEVPVAGPEPAALAQIYRFVHERLSGRVWASGGA
jgi:uncharacterized SAM-binding protein YcdF (DUF218 family)